MKDINAIEVLINIVLASFGGLVKRLSEMEKNPETKVTFAYYMTGSIISMFVGVVVYFVCLNFNVSSLLTAGITALSGYMGTPVLDLLSSLLSDKMKKYTDKL
ncbi:MAG: phage holin family protein [Firmicutes bacterium]|nr:phage holin family protein [Bacillota bacterium]